MKNKVLIGISIMALSAIETVKAITTNRKHPIVKAYAGDIDLEVRGNNDYYGPIYAGEEFIHNHVIYDTMSAWTILIDQDC